MNPPLGALRSRLWLGVALALVGCMSQANVSPEPTLVGEPLPGSFHLTSDPRLAPYALTIRTDEAGGPSLRTAEFAGGR